MIACSYFRKGLSPILPDSRRFLPTSTPAGRPPVSPRDLTTPPGVSYTRPMSAPSPPRLSLVDLTARLRGGLIVSCQALPDEPLYGAAIMARMAVAAEAGGAAGIRANSPVDIAAI